MIKGRFLYNQKLKDHPDLAVYGIFETSRVEWRYFVISHKVNNNEYKLSPELCSYWQEATHDTIRKYGKEFKTIEDGKLFIDEYKIKWETGSNSTKQEVRGKKLDEILDTDE